MYYSGKFIKGTVFTWNSLHKPEFSNSFRYIKKKRDDFRKEIGFKNRNSANINNLIKRSLKGAKTSIFKYLSIINPFDNKKKLKTILQYNRVTNTKYEVIVDIASDPEKKNIIV